ncbi:MAG: glycerol kinase GlpK [Cyclobacteriaceae bacterium]
MKYIIALDQGTTSSRAILFDHDANMVGISQKEFTQHFPQPGWVEHDPSEILNTQLEVLRELMDQQNVQPQEVTAIGLTNQRETVLVWDKSSGNPVYNAIVWQDKRTSSYCEELKARGLEPGMREKTGLVIDSYFSGTKLKWILDHVDGAREKAEAGQLLAGTIDTWLIWNLTNGAVHATDYTNASRTLLFNINEVKWDDELLAEFKIPASMLPETYPSSHHYGDVEIGGHRIPLMGVAGDQQSALFGQACFEKGSAKNTYGTGCFMLMNMGSKPVLSNHGLLTTMACNIDDEPQYAFEGSIFVAGAVVQWLRDGLQIINDAGETERIAGATEEDEVIIVPAFAGLGVPYWDSSSKGAIFGLTRDSGRGHFVKAALESIAYQTKDVLKAMEEDTRVKMENLMVDGGACANNYLMQFQSDILGITVDRPEILESTALGAAFLAGLKAGIWTIDDLKTKRKTERLFIPDKDETKRVRRYGKWKNAVSRTLNWKG